MANVQFGNYTPTEEPKDTTEYVYYTREGEYLGGIAGSAKIFLTTKEKYDAAVAAKDFSTVNDEATLVKYDDKAMTHSDFRYIAYVVKQESGETDIKELRCIAFASHNRSVNTKKTWRALLASSYSSVPDKKELPDKNDDKSKLTRQAELDVLNGVEDLTKGAEFWDGTDFLAWGNSEQNPYNKLGQNKFDEYKFIEIPKDVYDAFLAAQNTTSTTYGDSGNHDLQHDHGTHEHIKVKNKKTGVEKSKLRYDIPAAEFKDQQYWTSGSFYYETGAKVTNGISATISAGKSIFWKVTATRLTSATAQPAQPGQPQPGPPPQQPGQPPRPGGGPPQQPPRPGAPPQQPPRPGGQPPVQPPHQ